MSRKYGQRGYQEDDRPEPRRAPSGPRPDRDGPRGRGLGAPTASSFRCHACGTQRPLSEPLTPDTTCGQCGAALHACVNCRHFDSGARFECRQPISARLPSKTRANTCELFEPKQVSEFASERSKPGDAKSAFDALFDF